MTPRSVLLLLLLAAPAFSAEAVPGAAEWAPVQQAIAGGAPDAQDRLTTLLRTYPAWADGDKALARLLLDQGKAAEALAAAKRATQLAPDDTESLQIQVRALADLKRKAEVYALVDAAGGKDPKGWLRYEAGLAAVSFNDAAKAEGFLKEAKARIGAKVPAEFLFLESRIAILNREFARGELALASATTQQPDFWDGWYELGRVRLVLADSDGARRPEWVKKAGEAFAAVVKGVPADPAGHIGLARVSLERAKQLAAEGQADNAGGLLRDAVSELNAVIERRADLAEAYVLLGDAQIRLEQWEPAAAALQKAKALGATDRSLTFNLAIALQQTGKGAEAEALLKSVTAASPAEQVTIGMGAYRSRNWLLAATLLEKAVDGLEDAAAQGAVWRFIGHAHSRLAEAHDGDAQAAQLDAASEAYRKAGNLADFPSRRFYLAAEAARSPERAYTAAWTGIGWDALNLAAWSQVAANYGAAKTGGKGIGGMASRAPLHLGIWGALVLLPLAFFVVGLARRGKGSATTARPSTRAAPARAKSATQPPAAPLRPAAGRPRVQEKTATEPIAPPGAAKPVNQKAETVALASTAKPGARPQIKPGLKRTPSQIIPPSTADQTMMPTPSPEGRAQALERRKP